MRTGRDRIGDHAMESIIIMEIISGHITLILQQLPLNANAQVALVIALGIIITDI